jgi:hypothetical protein
MVQFRTLRAPDRAEVQRLTDSANGEIGNVVIEAVDCDTFLLALNNSDADELEAARTLGLVPQVRVYAQTDRIHPAAFDWFSFAEWTKHGAKEDAKDEDEDEDNKPPPRRHYLASEIADRIFDPGKAWAFEFKEIAIQD